MKTHEKNMAHCVHCDYPIFAYHHICPMCSKPIEKQSLTVEPESVTTTRFDFWVANLKRSLSTRPRNTAALELQR